MPFTQQQLEEAYKQMQDERAAEAALASLAGEWVSQQIGHQHPLYPTPYSQMHWWHTPLNSPGPHPVTYIVKIPWSQYEDYFSHPFVIARCQIPHNRQDIDRISFDVDMTGVAGFPNGYIIKVGFQFNDAHMGGY